MCSVLDPPLCLTLSVSALYTLFTGKDVSSSDHATTILSMFFYATTRDCDSHRSEEDNGTFNGDSLRQAFSYVR